MPFKPLGSSDFVSHHYTEIFRTRWPDQWLVLTGVSAPELDPAPEATSFSRAFFKDPEGKCIEAIRSVDIQLYKILRSCGNLSDSHLFVQQGGPILLGRWIWDNRGDLSFIKLTPGPEHSFYADISVPFRCRIEFDSTSNTSDLELRTITFSNRDNVKLYSFTYEKYQKFPDNTASFPTRRITTIFNKSDISKGEQPSLSRRVDTLAGIDLNKPLSQADMTVSLVGFKEAARPSRNSETAASPPVDTTHSHESMIADRSTLLLLAIIAVLCGTVFFLVFQRRARS